MTEWNINNLYDQILERREKACLDKDINTIGKNWLKEQPKDINEFNIEDKFFVAIDKAIEENWEIYWYDDTDYILFWLYRPISNLEMTLSNIQNNKHDLVQNKENYYNTMFFSFNRKKNLPFAF